MSKILKKSLAIMLVLALCFSSVICASAADANYTAAYNVTFDEASNDEITATVAITSTANDLAAMLFTLNLPGLPIKAVSTDSVYELSTNPDYEDGLPMNDVTSLRVLLDSKATGSSYNYANIYITFDVSSKALVDLGVDPDVPYAFNIAIDKMEAASYNTGAGGFEGDVWIKASDTAQKNEFGQVVASSNVTGSCSHDYDVVRTEDPTCSKFGNDHKTCKLCGKQCDEQVSKVAHSWGDYEVTTPAGCLTDGVETRVCSVCTEKETRPIPQIGHHTFVEEYDADPEHFQITEGDCSTEGTAYAICTKCGTVDTTPINLGYGDHCISAPDSEVHATCGADGYIEGWCDYCFEFVRVANGEKATGNHAWDEGTVDVPATTTTKGSMKYHCDVCGQDKYEEIPVLEECDHKSLAAAVYEANATTGFYDAVIKCADCEEEVYRLATDIPSTTSVNNSINVTRTCAVQNTIGITYMTTNAELTSYASYGVRVYRLACDGSYDLYTANCGELNKFTNYGSKKKYVAFSGIGLYELNLPVVAVLCGYDTSGNLIGVSKPMDNNPVDMIWNLYSNGATAVQKTCYVDLMNLASESQTYFAPDGSELAGVSLPNVKYAFDQNDATAEMPSYNLATMPNSITNNPSATVNTTTYGLLQSLSIATGSPTIGYNIKNANSKTKGKLDMSKLVLELSYTDGYGKAQSKVVTGAEATATSDPWATFSTYYTYTYADVALYDTNKALTAKFIYDGVEMYTALYSVETFIAQNYTNADMGASLVAIAKFGASARAYFGVQ